MDQNKMITICDARVSQSGKTLGIKDQSGAWYSTKHFELQNMVGQAIYGQCSTSEFNGKTMHWINEYTLPDGTSQAQAAPMQPMPQAQAQAQAQAVGQPAHQLTAVDRDASIVAQTLCKTITFSNAQEAFTAYSWLYDKYIVWSKANPVPSQEEQLVQQAQAQSPVDERNPPAFDDDIPFSVVLPLFTTIAGAGYVIQAMLQV